MAKTRNRDENGPQVGRRRFMAGAAVAGVGMTVSGIAPAQEAAKPAPAAKSGIPIETAAAEQHPPAHVDQLTTGSTGSDYMVDVLKSLDIQYIASNPGSTFRALQESIVNYGGNKMPEFLTCCHEESAVGIAHGYAKAAGKPMATLLHGTVGMMHGSMAIYNAYVDRVPILVMTGNAGNATNRRPGVEWAHSAQDGASLVRDFTKWDDQPASLDAFGNSLIRAYKIAVTAPQAPVLIVADGDLQEDALEEDTTLRVPRLTKVMMPAGDPNAVREAAKLLVAAENPVILVDRYARSAEGMEMLIALAEAVQAPACDLGSRMNFPNTHHLNHSERRGALIAQADLIFAIEPVDLWGTMNRMRDQLHRTTHSTTKPGVKVVSIGLGGDFMAKSNYQDFQHYTETDLAIAGDGEATMPGLLDAVRQAIAGDRRAALDARGEKLKKAFAGLRDRARAEAAYGWDASPITTARMCMELWNVIKDSDWVIASQSTFQSNWPNRLWSFDKQHRHIGGAGGAGVGYGLPAAVGAALAGRDKGRLTVNIQGDGDLMYAPGALWTAAHHKIPLLTVVHNNRAYHQELMHVQRMANRHNRGTDRAHIGTTLTDPLIDYATVAKGMGVYSIGPISNAADLGPALQKAVDVVKRGEPALVDVVAQPR
jgi:acetolactate synthase I/II/III large subunit